MKQSTDKVYQHKRKSLYSKTAAYLYYRAEPKYLNPLHYLRSAYESYARNKLSRENRELFEHLEEIRIKSQSTGCSYSDYYTLYKMIQFLNPKYVLECGSGISTLVIAYALREQYDKTKLASTFISAEEDRFYHEQIKSIFPETLKAFVDFQRLEREETFYNSYRGCYYAKIPELPYEFVFIDGPTLRKTPDSIKCFNSDIINILTKSRNKTTALLDQRIETLHILKILLPTAKITYNPIKRLTKIIADPTSLTPNLSIGDNKV